MGIELGGVFRQSGLPGRGSTSTHHLSPVTTFLTSPFPVLICAESLHFITHILWGVCCLCWSLGVGERHGQSMIWGQWAIHDLLPPNFYRYSEGNLDDLTPSKTRKLLINDFIKLPCCVRFLTWTEKNIIKSVMTKLLCVIHFHSENVCFHNQLYSHVYLLCCFC